MFGGRRGLLGQGSLGCVWGKGWVGGGWREGGYPPTHTHDVRPNKTPLRIHQHVRLSSAISPGELIAPCSAVPAQAPGACHISRGPPPTSGVASEGGAAGETTWGDDGAAAAAAGLPPPPPKAENSDSGRMLLVLLLRGVACAGLGKAAAVAACGCPCVPRRRSSSWYPPVMPLCVGE